MMLVLQQYELSLQYHPGKEIPVSDTLSQMYLPDQNPEIQIEGEYPEQDIRPNGAALEGDGQCLFQVTPMPESLAAATRLKYQTLGKRKKRKSKR
ncbi:hypothetical protein QYM36_000641 [Artemia franciscana]|uniref:Uncharacterized protein n=1 Tax=Artemia franciscana TaxID=6661 RepID=A0AA88LDC8_ARTSF|nr:hypothetical protein QYM36_000641 [Artemia franciscana]